MSTKKQDNITVSLDLSIVSGHIASINDEITFNAVIKNRNDYNRNLTSLNFTKLLDENLFTFIEDSLTQDDNPITKNDDDSYTLADISNNAQSVISFKATVAQLAISVTNPSVNLNFSYLDSNNEDKTSSISNSYYLYLTNPITTELTVDHTVDLANAKVEDELTYTLTLTNNSSDVLNYVFVKDIFDEFTEFVDGSVLIDDTPMVDLDIVAGFQVGPMDDSSTKTIIFKAIAIKRGYCQS